MADKTILQSLLPNEILALTIWGEARGEPIEGQIAVANVIMNRFRNNLKKYKTLDKVCLEKLQFSCWNEDDPNFDKLLALAKSISLNKDHKEKYLRQCHFIASGVISGALLDNTGAARNYITKELFLRKRPVWAKKPINPTGIGNHIFFNV